jgi:hypothetical protein
VEAVANDCEDEQFVVAKAANEALQELMEEGTAYVKHGFVFAT